MECERGTNAREKKKNIELSLVGRGRGTKIK